MIVDVYIRELICDTTTSEGGLGRLRDEVYIQVFGSTPSGNISVRLPRSHYGDDYYWFYANQVSNVNTPKLWISQDEALVGEPRIWSGNLDPGREADLYVVIAEQDNLQVVSITDALSAALDRAETNVGSDQWAGAAVAGARQFINQIPDSRDDIIGVFLIHLRNNNDILETTWVPLKDIPFRGTRGQTTLENPDDHFARSLRDRGEEVMSFIFHGAIGGVYRGMAAVNSKDGAPDVAHQYLITEFDACDPDAPLRIYDPLNVTTAGFRELALLNRGEVASVPVSMPNWIWRCGDSWEVTRGAHSDIRFVTVHRHERTGQIRWYCFNNENWDGSPIN